MIQPDFRIQIRFLDSDLKPIEKAGSILCDFEFGDQLSVKATSGPIPLIPENSFVVITALIPEKIKCKEKEGEQ